MTALPAPIAAADPRPGGIAIEARLRPSRSAVARLIVHEGIAVDQHEPGAVHVSAARASSLYFAFYSAAVLETRRQPYDLAGAAYLPLPYASLHVQPIDGYGAMLVQKEPDPRPLDATVIDDGVTSVFVCFDDVDAVRRFVVDLARRAGVPERGLAATRTAVARISAAPPG